jgi:hypothetical protein
VIANCYQFYLYVLAYSFSFGFTNSNANSQGAKKSLLKQKDVLQKLVGKVPSFFATFPSGFPAGLAQQTTKWAFQDFSGQAFINA